jgi:hypothetical protein
MATANNLQLKQPDAQNAKKKNGYPQQIAPFHIPFLQQDQYLLFLKLKTIHNNTTHNAVVYRAPGNPYLKNNKKEPFISPLEERRE